MNVWVRVELTRPNGTQPFMTIRYELPPGERFQLGPALEWLARWAADAKVRYDFAEDVDLRIRVESPPPPITPDAPQPPRATADPR